MMGSMSVRIWSHEIQPPSTSYMLRSQRTMSSIQHHNVGGNPKDIYELMTLHAGGADKVNYTHRDLENYLRAKRQPALHDGQAQSLLNYFPRQSRLDLNYFSHCQLDEDNQIKNISWADGEMRADYCLFGDVIAFDTTFNTNKNQRPFGVFVGFNHHMSTVTFGATLLYDETTESFQWLFEVFLNAHDQKSPKTIFTDQDAAMTKAISIAFPGTSHGLCTFHIMNNAAKHMICHGKRLVDEFAQCMYVYKSEEEFQSAWQQIMQKGFMHLAQVHGWKGFINADKSGHTVI